MRVIGTNYQLCHFKTDVLYEEAYKRAKGRARCLHGRLQRANSPEALLPGQVLTAGLYTFLPLDIWGGHSSLCLCDTAKQNACLPIVSGSMPCGPQGQHQGGDMTCEAMPPQLICSLQTATTGTKQRR